MTAVSQRQSDITNHNMLKYSSLYLVNFRLKKIKFNLYPRKKSMMKKTIPCYCSFKQGIKLFYM